MSAGAAAAGCFAFIRDFGLILFVYTIGIQVGRASCRPRARGRPLGLALVMVGTGTAVAALLPVVNGCRRRRSWRGGDRALPWRRQQVRRGRRPGGRPGLLSVTYPFGIANVDDTFLRFAFRRLAAEAAGLEAGGGLRPGPATSTWPSAIRP
jgi:hypothetical protein